MNEEVDEPQTPNPEPLVARDRPRTSEPSRRKRVFLVDGNSYLYRAFHATPFLSNSQGIPTNATYAFLSMIRKLRNEENPDTLVIIFDSKGPTFREEISEAYKAQRPPMPGNLILQLPYVKGVVEAMGLPILEKDGFEADDIIATIVEKLKDEDCEIFIVTSDKDMMQLVSPTVFIYDTMKNLTIGEDGVVAKFGIRPAHVLDYLALCGDTSDNIPGVPGVGDKTARDLVSEFGPIEELYRRVDEVKKPSVREKLKTGRDLAFMSKELACLRRDVPLDRETDSFSLQKEDTATLKRLYRELEFTSLYKALKGDEGGAKPFITIELSGLTGDHVYLAARFQGKNPYDARLEGFAAFDGSGVFYSRSEEDLSMVLSRAPALTCHHLKPIAMFLKKRKEELRGPAFDTMLAAYLVNPLRKDYGITPIIAEYLDVELAHYDTKEMLAHDDTREMLAQLACRLPDLKEILLKEMEEKGLVELFADMEMPLIEVLSTMEYYGVRIDREILFALSRDFDKRLTIIMKAIYALAGGPFNINSPQQLSRILFDTLNLPTRKKTKTGFSTDTEVLEALAPLHPLPKEILEYRTLTKLKGTYIDVLPTLINPGTGRIHASFNQMVTATGRLSSSDPNLQNIPIRGGEGMKIREAFVPADGFVLLSSDYSQIELRILAHISRDPLLVETFLRDEDVHSTVARTVFGVLPGMVTPDMRRTAKVINFGIIYGMSSFGLAKELGVSQREAQIYIHEYFEKHKGVKEYMENILEEVRERGYVKTIFGRRRYIPEINNSDNNVRQLGERSAMNMPIQGTAADIIKLAMVHIHRKIREKGLASRLIMQIHDELVFEAREDEVGIMETLVREEMEQVVNLSVPLKVSLGTGKNWATAHE